MHIQRHKQNGKDGGITGYTMNLSLYESAGFLTVIVDQNGLCYLFVDGQRLTEGIDGHDLEAIISDHLPDDCKHLWPAWGNNRKDRDDSSNQKP